MPQLLLELFSEEIPARMQAGAARDLERMARERLSSAQLPIGTIATFSGPRRLTLVVDGLPEGQADRSEERKGPRVGAPDTALHGFLRSAGVAREALVERNGTWFAVVAREGRPTRDLIAEMVPAIVGTFPWPKSMTWGHGKLRWVRPLHRVLCLFDGRIVRFAVDGIESGDQSEGHRFMGDPTPFRARDFAEYRQILESRFVVLDAADRKQRIIEGATALCSRRGVVLVEDAALVDEVAGMVEWPAPVMGDIKPSFLSLPPEVIRTTMRMHQRYFAVADKDGKLAPHFIAVANIDSADGADLIAAGNARVLAARLADANFFWKEDLKQPLDGRLPALNGVTFHARLGHMGDRAERIETMARAVAAVIGADAENAALAARLAKADLTTAMVGEFPELQGVMGGYYARSQGLSGEVADAIRDHYKPQGPSDSVPTAPLSVAVALADKMDTILAFFSIGEAPTGSRDPFGLRRAALGVIRILLENRLRLPLGALIAASAFPGDGVAAFFAERLKVSLRERGERHDLIDAVFALNDDDLVRVVSRVEALASFAAKEEGANLLAAYKRAGNIIAAESRKGPLPQSQLHRPQGPAQEVALFDALEIRRPRVASALAREDFVGALEDLACLRPTIDAFFDAVLVNSPVASERANRLALLAGVRETINQVADFSLISG